MKKDTKKTIRKLTGHSVLYGLGTVGARLLAFITVPIVTRYFSVEEYGIIGLMGTMSGLLGYFFNMNASVLINNDYINAEEESRRKTILSTMYYFGVACSIIFGVIFIFLSGLMAKNLFNRIDYILFVQITVIGCLFASTTGVAEKYLQISQKVGLFSLVSFSFAAIYAVLRVISITLFQVQVAEFLWIRSLILLLTALAYFYILRKELVLRVSLYHIKEILRIGLPTILHSLAHWGLTSIDMVFLQKYSSETEVGFYSFAYKFGFFMNVFVYGFALTWGPHTSRTLVKYKREASRELLIEEINKPFKIAFSLICCAGFLISLFAPEGTLILATRKYAESLKAIPLIILGYLFLTMYYSISTVPYYFKQNKYLFLSTSAAAVANVVLNRLFIPRYGMMAAAATTAASYLLLFLFTAFVVGRMVSFPISVARCFLVITVTSLMYLGFLYFYPESGRITASRILLKALLVLINFNLVVFIMYPGAQYIKALRLIMKKLKRRLGIK